MAEELGKQDRALTNVGQLSKLVEDNTKGLETLDMDQTILSGNITEDVGAMNKFWAVVAVINDSYDYEKFL